MALKVLGKINGRLKYRKQSFLSPSFKRLLCNALIQPHFDFANLAWYTNLNKMLRKKLQAGQNKCIRFCLGMGNRDHIGESEFKKINWLPTRERYEQSILTSIYKFFNNLAPAYYEEIYCPMNQIQVTRFSFQKLTLPSQKSNRGLRTITYLGPRLWNSLPRDLKASSNANTFKHKLKSNLFEELKREKKVHTYFIDQTTYSKTTTYHSNLFSFLSTHRFTV